MNHVLFWLNVQSPLLKNSMFYPSSKIDFYWSQVWQRLPILEQLFYVGASTRSDTIYKSLFGNWKTFYSEIGTSFFISFVSTSKFNGATYYGFSKKCLFMLVSHFLLFGGKCILILKRRTGAAFRRPHFLHTTVFFAKFSDKRAASVIQPLETGHTEFL